MRKLIVSEWISLDGVFDASLMQQWWLPFDSEGRQKYIQDTINNCEVMLYGRRTYDMLYPYWSSFSHNEQGVADQLNNGKKYVVSSKLKHGAWRNTTVINDNFVNAVKDLKKEDGGYILVQGSASLLKPLLEAGLVDELRLLINPAIVGKGERVFNDMIHCNLKYKECRSLDKNVILISYEADNSATATND